MDDKDLTYILYIAAGPDRVWHALTSNDYIPRYWFGRSIETDWSPASRISIKAPDGQVDVYGDILECQPNSNLAYTFNITGYPSSEVHFELMPFGDVTRLTLTHLNHTPEPLPPDAPEIQQRGWMIILNGLKTLVESGRPLTENPAAFAK